MTGEAEGCMKLFQSQFFGGCGVPSGYMLELSACRVCLRWCCNKDGVVAYDNFMPVFL